MAGQVYVDQQKADKPGDLYPEDAQIEARGKALPLCEPGRPEAGKGPAGVSALFGGPDLHGRGGPPPGALPTACCKTGPEKVYAVDVGYGQLAWSLRSDPRVVNLERTNARVPHPGAGARGHRLFLRDVSFISLSLILPAVRPLLAEQGRAVCLIKPSLRRAGRRWGRREWSGTPPCTGRSSRRHCSCPEGGVLRAGADLFPGEGGRRGTSSIWCTCSAATPPPRTMPCPPPPRWWEASHKELDR